ncbi:hypothetical protein KI387_043904 [Taxus chinensis]|uniref:Uncharacterized protein n=1 Tax=Taxus chinensis TaxID=29808 RepID=A0AA38GKW2_TAXCH|nr:hypothetical protein KI387_043904 [Taxus chinensis]
MDTAQYFSTKVKGGRLFYLSPDTNRAGGSYRAADKHERSRLQGRRYISSEAHLSMENGNTGNSQTLALGTWKKLVFVNAKQYKGILRRRHAKKLRQTQKKNLTLILPKTTNNKGNFVFKDYQIQGKQSIRKEGREDPKLSKTEKIATNKDEREEAMQDPKQLYNPISTPLMWSSLLYVNELMSMKERLGTLENWKVQEDNKRKECAAHRHKLERENKVLKERVLNLQNLMERGQQELVVLKHDLGHLKAAGEKNIETLKGNETFHINEIQSAIKNMEIKENQLSVIL